MGKDECVDGAWEVQPEALTVREGAGWGDEGWAVLGWERQLCTPCRSQP